MPKTALTVHSFPALTASSSLVAPYNLSLAARSRVLMMLRPRPVDILLALAAAAAAQRGARRRAARALGSECALVLMRAQHERSQRLERGCGSYRCGGAALYVQPVAPRAAIAARSACCLLVSYRTLATAARPFCFFAPYARQNQLVVQRTLIEVVAGSSHKRCRARRCETSKSHAHHKRQVKKTRASVKKQSHKYEAAPNPSALRARVPALTMVGVYTALYTAGEFIARYIYEEPDYVFGDATALMLDSAEAGLLEFGNVSLVALRRLFGHDALEIQRRSNMSLRPFSDKRPCSYSGASTGISFPSRRPRPRLNRATTLVIECASAFRPQSLLSAAVRSADDAALANKARIVLASGDAVVSNDSVPAALQEALAMVLEAKKQLASPHHRTAEDRVRLCRDLVRAAIDGGSKASSPSDAYKHWTEDGGTGADALAGVLLRRAAAGLRKNLGERATPPWTTSSSKC